MQFSTLRLSNPVLRALADEGYATPTPIQAQAIPPVLEGRDLLGCAQTGTGKTAAFALPIIHRLHTAPVDKTRRGPVIPRALILSPTRELAAQIGDSFVAYGRHSGLSCTVVFGGVSQHRQVTALKRGVDVLVATPGRLIDLMEQGLVNLSGVRVLVLDEADRMLDMGFIQPIRRIAAATPKERQTLLFSATMPKEIMRLAESLLRDPVKVAVTPVASAAPLIDQSVYMAPRTRKQALLEHLLREGRIGRALVFTRTKRGADRVCKWLNHAGLGAEAIHGNKAQNHRVRALESFRSGRSRVLVATDVAARGLDVDAISHVFNYDLPNEAESYIHRIGRTGRNGATGIAISFCDAEEREFLRAIEKLTGKKIPVTALPDMAEWQPPAPPTRTAHTASAAQQRPAQRNGAGASPRQGSRPHGAQRSAAPAHGGRPHGGQSHGTHAPAGAKRQQRPVAAQSAPAHSNGGASGGGHPTSGRVTGRFKPTSRGGGRGRSASR